MAPPPRGGNRPSSNHGTPTKRANLQLLLQQQHHVHQLTGVNSEITIKPLLLKQHDKQESLSNDFEWDNDFIENGDDELDDDEKQTLLNEEDRENDNLTTSNSTTSAKTTSAKNLSKTATQANTR